MNNLVAINYYLFDSCLGNKYARYRLNKTLKANYLYKNPENDNLFTFTA
jgi:hypothetical protein